MKGFIHIVESVIVTILLLIVLSQFFYFAPKNTYWEELNLERLSRDILFTLSHSGDKTLFLNETDARREIRKLLPGVDVSNIDFSVNVQGTIPPVIRIGCNCTEAQRADLGVMLSNVTYNGRTVVFDINHILPTMEINNFSDIDVLLIHGYHGISSDEANEIINFMKRGGGVVEVSDLNNVNVDINHKAIFGIESVSSSTSGTGEIIFTNSGDKTLPNYRLWEYFSHVPATVRTDVDETISCGASKRGELDLNDVPRRTNACVNGDVYVDIGDDGSYGEGDGPFRKGDSFTVGGYSFTVRHVNGDAKYYTIDMPDDYEFNNFLDADEKVNASRQDIVAVARNGQYCNPSCDAGYQAAVVTNSKVQVANYQGRSVWISHSSGTDWEHLLKTSIAWSTGEKYSLIRFKNIPPGSLGAEYYINYHGDLFEPVKVILTLWYVF